MNEFISNSGTLINPDSVYDQERFINILQIILQKKTQKELSEKLETYAVYICRGSISRIEDQSRTVTDIELYAISKILQISIEELFD